MVLWEITLGTAYFLGLKRTYRLALKIQRRIVGPKHPRIRQFLHRRTRQVFDVALNVHKSIQERDIEVGRNLGNWILRWLDRMKPEAHIRAPPEQLPCHTNSSTDKAKKISESSHLKTSRNTQSPQNRESDRLMFVSSRKLWPKSFPTVSMMIRPPRPTGTMNQYRHHYIMSEASLVKPSFTTGGLDSVIRKDIFQWMAQK
ncbi:PREDICTED: uncharacterized protein LOC104814421 [Tarenaya hassleriana]|uniref:uncharacterized protein LOC104814421 n=1 Tax=Tarenaya hassleriana TaxID=28532 RepID=UPI00053C9428|nr:PREDICTED: uncharacterized protein LOC104814421 [Tarenaya hassleriana]